MACVQLIGAFWTVLLAHGEINRPTRAPSTENLLQPRDDFKQVDSVNLGAIYISHE
jgi:hypothetical protein